MTDQPDLQSNDDKESEQELLEHRELQNASATQQAGHVRSLVALTDSQRDLYDRMSEISEDGYCARWIHDNEYAIWDALQGADARHGIASINPRLLRRCKLLSEEVGGWVYWADAQTDPSLPREVWGARFAPMAQWLAMVEARRNP